jgi:hypothetical protein
VFIIFLTSMWKQWITQTFSVDNVHKFIHNRVNSVELPYHSQNGKKKHIIIVLIKFIHIGHELFF